MSFAGNLGDVQHIADRPAAPVFATSRLVVRVQVVAAGAQAEVLDDGCGILAAGARRITVQPLPAAPFGQTVRWQADCDSDGAHVEGVLYEAVDPVPLDMRTAVAALGFTLEMSRLGESACTHPPVRTDEGFAWPAAGLVLRSPGYADHAL